MIDWVVAEHIPGDFTFDAYCTNAPIQNHIHASGRTYIGDLKANRVIEVSGKEQRVGEWAKSRTALVRTKFTVGGHTQW